MDPASAFTLAHESLGICIAIGKQAKAFIEKYRSALDDLETLDLTVVLASQTAEEFQKSLEQLPTQTHSQVSKVFDRLVVLFQELEGLLQRYDINQLRRTDRLHWALRGKATATKTKKKIDDWLGQVFPLVLTALVRVGVLEQLPQKEVMKRVDDGIGELRQFVKDLPGLEEGIAMRAAQEATKSSTFSSAQVRNIHIQTPWQPIIIDLSQSLEIEKPPLEFQSNSITAENYSFACVMLQDRSDKPIPALLEHRPFLSDTESQVVETCKRVAPILSQVDPAIFNVPKCLGFFRDVENSRYSLIMSRQFSVRDVGVVNATQYTLEDAIGLFQTYRTSKTPLTPIQKTLVQCLNDLESRTDLAIQLVRALSYIHAVSWVHKSFRSGNIVLCLTEKSDKVVPLIVGFHRARHICAASNKEEVLLWDSIVYRHPDRWMESNNPEFRPEYDIYSLGVVLLEIGLGKLARSIVPPPKFLDAPTSGSLSSGESQSKENSESVTHVSSPMTKQEAGQIINAFLRESKQLKHKQGSTFSDIVHRCIKLGEDATLATPGFLSDMHAELSSAKY